ncbi:MAG TPA: hypothetical protein VFZ61_25735 [Polyangiales bacterium]
MWLQAIITADDLMHALHELTPTRIQLDDNDPDKAFELDPPSEVRFRENEGAIIRTSARLSWDVIGIKVPVNLRTVEVLLIPSIEQDSDGNDLLVLQAKLEDLDLSALPGLFDGAIRNRINQVLEDPKRFVRWGFIRTLDFSFHLPDKVQPRRDLRLAARWGATRVSDQGFVMAASFGFFAKEAEGAAAAQ